MVDGRASLHRRSFSFLDVMSGLILIMALFSYNPATLYGQTTAATDRINAERLLKRALAFQDNAKYKRSNELLKQSASLFLEAGFSFKVAHCYNHLSSNLRLMDKLGPAEKAAHRALDAVAGQPSGNRTEYIRSYTNLGLIFAVRADYTQARRWLEKAHRQLETPGISPYLKTTVTGSLGYLYDDLGQYDKAIAYYQEALRTLQSMAHPSQGRIAKLYNNIGYTYSNKGLYNRARKYFKKELKINLRLKGESHPDVAGAYINIGSSYYRASDYGQAVIYFKKSLASARKAYGRNHSMVALDYENIGMCYLGYGEFGKAIENLHNALEIRKKVLGPSHPDVALTYKHIAAVYARQRDYEAALPYARKALEIQKKGLGANHPKLVDSYNETGYYLARLGKPEQALPYLTTARSLALHSLGANHPLLAQTYAALGLAEEKNRHYNVSVTYYQQALRILSKKSLTDEPGDNPSAGAFTYPAFALDILFDKARSLDEASEITGDIRYLKSAIDTYQALSDLMDRMQMTYVNEESKLVIGERSHDIYEQAIESCFRLYQKEKDRNSLKQIFFFSEKSKARMILASVLKDDARHFSGIPDSLLTNERELDTRISNVRQEINDLLKERSVQNRQIAVLRDSLISLTRHRRIFNNRLGKNYPKYHRLMHASMIPPVEKIQQKLRRQDASVVEYMTGNHALFALVITGRDIRIHKLKFDDYLNEDIETFRKSIVNRRNTVFLNKGLTLYRILWAPLEEDLHSSNHVYIVPDGKLAVLPFEALLTQPVRDKSPDFQRLPYLLRNHELSYTPSIALSTALQARGLTTYKTDFLAFAPGFSKEAASVNRGPKATWRALPFSCIEVKEIDSLFTQSSGFWSFLFGGYRTRLYLNDRATEQLLKNSTPIDAKYMHFATHAFIGSEQEEPLKRENGIALRASSDQDGILYSREIYNLAIHTDLVVLSACETGIGSMVKGEGIMSLSRAFQYAGAENMMVSLWEVADRASSKLMIEFYRQQLKKDDKSRSLQQAKERLIDTTSFANPFYWASFILIGN